jgi:hypothetical protein
MTRSEIWMVFGALLLALFWLASPAAAQIVMHGDGSVDVGQGTPQCDDGSDNDNDGKTDTGDGDCSEEGTADPDCCYNGQPTPWWNDEWAARGSALLDNVEGTGCGGGGGAEEEVLALLVPLVWLYGRRRGRKA